MLLILGLVASTWPYLRCDVGLEEVEYLKKCLCATVLCTIIMCTKVPEVLTGRSTVSGFDLAWFSFVF